MSGKELGERDGEGPRALHACAAMAGRGWMNALPLYAGSLLGGALLLEVLLLRQRASREHDAGGRTGAFPFFTLASLLYLLGNALENARRFLTASPSTRGVMLAGAGQGWE